MFTPEGRVKTDPISTLKISINKITKAPLKPQQRMFALRTMILPSIYHQLTLDETPIGVLNKIDASIRASIRKWVNLPHDVPIAYFHANVKDGGLSIPSMRWLMPLHRTHRLRNIRQDKGQENEDFSESFMKDEEERATRRLEDGGVGHVGLQNKNRAEVGQEALRVVRWKRIERIKKSPPTASIDHQWQSLPEWQRLYQRH